MAWPHEQFTELFDTLYPGLVRFLRAFCGDEELARDATQEAFVRLYRAGPAAVPAEAARYWILRTSRNLILNEMNRRRRWSRLAPLFGATRTATQPAADVSHLQQEENRMQSALIAELSRDQRSALLLREMEQMSYRDIAAVLDVSVSKVKVDIHRARLKLRKTWIEGSGSGRREQIEVDHGM